MSREPTKERQLALETLESRGIYVSPKIVARRPHRMARRSRLTVHRRYLLLLVAAILGAVLGELARRGHWFGL